jgi:DnaJ-class molecular chaperone
MISKKEVLKAKREIATRILEHEQLRQACGVKTCKRCHGAGWIMGKPTRTCPDCKGTGKDEEG